MPETRTPRRQAGGRRAAIYARVSDKSQAEDDKTSIAEQISDMEAYCEERGLTITARYQEVGRGWSKQRPDFQRMLADAASGRFDTIVCWKSDRLSRGMYPAAALMEVVEAHRIGIEAVMDAIDLKTFGLMAAIGKIELDNFRERASMGKRGAAKQGRIPVNHVPDGYRITEGRTPEVDDERAAVIRRIFRHSVHDGMGAPAIAEALEADAVPTARPGARWHAAQVNRILRNEAYRGTWWYGKVRHTATDAGMRRHPQPRERWVGVPFPPLVDGETWERAQALRKRRLTRSPRNTKTFHLLQHLVRCSECGMLMGPNVVRSQSVRKGGKTYRYELDPPRRYYQCYGMRTHRLRCREHPVIRAERLEELVWGEVRRVLERPELIAAGLAALEPDEDGGLAGEIARTERELAGVQAEEDRAIRLYVSGKISEEQLDHQQRFIGERLERLRARLDEYRARESSQAGRRVALEQVVEWARGVGAGLDGLGGEERRELLDLLLEDATIDGENRVTLTLAIPADDEFVPIAEPEPTTPSTRCGRRHAGPGASASPSPSRSSSWPTGERSRRTPSSWWRRSCKAPSPSRGSCPRTASPPTGTTATTSCSRWRGRSSRARRTPARSNRSSPRPSRSRPKPRRCSWTTAGRRSRSSRRSWRSTPTATVTARAASGRAWSWSRVAAAPQPRSPATAMLPAERTATKPRSRSSRCSPGPSSWPKSRSSHSGVASGKPPRSPSSSGR